MDGGPRSSREVIRSALFPLDSTCLSQPQAPWLALPRFDRQRSVCEMWLRQSQKSKDLHCWGKRETNEDIGRCGPPTRFETKPIDRNLWIRCSRCVFFIPRTRPQIFSLADSLPARIRVPVKKKKKKLIAAFEPCRQLNFAVLACRCWGLVYPWLMSLSRSVSRGGADVQRKAQVVRARDPACRKKHKIRLSRWCWVQNSGVWLTRRACVVWDWLWEGWLVVGWNGGPIQSGSLATTCVWSGVDTVNRDRSAALLGEGGALWLWGARSLPVAASELAALFAERGSTRELPRNLCAFLRWRPRGSRKPAA